MTYEDFLAVGLRLQKIEKIRLELMKLGVDVLDLFEPYDEIVMTLIKEIYGEEGLDWFSWFCYESEFGQKDWSKAATYIKNDDGTSTKVHEAGEKRYGATDEEGNPICYDWESLYNYLEQLKNGKK
jgi:hypothetical protein